ncbi:DUF2827 domain-containing protein [Variovorax boronicumulans]|uniref:DUF2827 domain-containing protein n=1 Tax=Variovorax boronicumulans TaxID=436515 RepID=UPI0033996253
MRIGISVITHAGQNIWENGLGQNVVFLARLFQQLPFVRSVILIDVGDQHVMPEQVDMNAMGLRLMRAHEAADEVDVIIEMAGALDPQWLALQRARGKKVVYYCAGQPYAGAIESSVFDKPSHFPRPDRCDEVWLLPEYQTFASFQRVLQRCPVRVVPYLWHPQFLAQRIEDVSRLGFSFGWKAGTQPAAGLRVAIFEPNISVAKTSSISMLACDEACRAEPGSVAMMSVLNTLHLKDHPTMLYFANQLDLVKQHKAVFLGRHDIVGFMVQHADAVVSHQWINDQNYSYLDALYGDYPLVHNSPWLQGFGAGYFYPGFEAAEGGRQLRVAAKEHDARLDDYRRRSRQVFDAVDPLNAANVEQYGRLLLDLQRNSGFEGAAA